MYVTYGEWHCPGAGLVCLFQLDELVQQPDAWATSRPFRPFSSVVSNAAAAMVWSVSRGRVVFGPPYSKDSRPDSGPNISTRVCVFDPDEFG